MMAPVLAALLVLALLPQPVAASPGADDTVAAAERKHCLGCHAIQGSAKKFSDGDSIPVHIDRKAFERSIHGSLPCSACHEEFSDRRHPDRVFRTKQQYMVRESRRCLSCHPDETINARPIHESLLKKERAGQPRICTNCHSAHSAQRVRKGGVSAMEEQYCMRCHRHQQSLHFAAGGSVSVQVDTAVIAGSAHRNLGCTDCHHSFSPSEHPRRQFRSIREYRLAASELCRRCHFDKQAKVIESIHYSLVSTGRLDAPTCVDCHGGHAVVGLGADRMMTVRKCASCHAQVYAEYAKSVHGSALRDAANRDVPTCIDCHSSHTIRPTRSAAFHDAIPDTCSGCHGKKEIMAKYGLTTAVVRTYLSDFHGMTLQLYRKEVQSHQRSPAPMAVCSDCHGIHNIARAAGEHAAAMKSNLLKRCQSCHPGASENFPDAWLSHYEASLATMPLVFILEWFYRIMLVVMVAGLIFQIVLDIRRRLDK
jgi:predicted CXXCH cytochrome family protein